MHQRPLPTIRSSSSVSPSVVSSRAPTPRHSPMLPPASYGYPADKYDAPLQQHQLQLQHPTICGMPLKYVSLVTLAVQNAALSIVMHYSRVSIPVSMAYSPATAVLMNELLKGSISFVIALCRSPVLQQQPLSRRRASSTPLLWWFAFSDLCGEIFSPDCWKLSIPAILYVIQNSLQFVAISNLPVASFQVTYQMKILTTAAFSVALLRKKLTSVKWLSLFFLAIGVGIVQIQNSSGSGIKPSPTGVGSAHEFLHIMNPLKGFGAVTAACFTSGLELSLFSLIPALLPILWATPPPNSQGFVMDLFRNFGGWAWATVAIQVFGGLITAIVIKYSDNILKGFATSLSIVLSFLASVALFDFHITPSFVVGASTVLGATWMYNQPSPPVSTLPSAVSSPIAKEPLFSVVLNDASPTSSEKSSPSPSPYYPGTPTGPESSSVLGLGSFMRKKSGGFSNASRNSSTTSLSGLLSASQVSSRGELGLAESGELVPLSGMESEYGTPFSSKPPSRMPSRAPSPTIRSLGGYNHPNGSNVSMS